MNKRTIAISFVAGLILAAVLPPVWAQGCEDRAAPAAAPKWVVGDSWTWDMDKIVRYVNSYTDENGTLNITYLEDDQLITDTVAAIESAMYRMAFSEFEYLNGTWNFKPSLIGEGNGWLESNGTIKATFDKSGSRHRSVADFSLVNASVKMAYRYGSLRLDGNYRVFNWSGNETHTLSTDNPLNSLKFPLTPDDGWMVDTNLTDTYNGVKEWPEYPAWGTPSYSGSRYDHYQYCVTVATDTEVKSVPAGSFECYKLTDSGKDLWGWSEGTASGMGITNYAQNRWWSRVAGTTANTNETTRLESFVHVANLPPTLDIIPTKIVSEDQNFTIPLALHAHDPDIVNGTGDFLKYNATCSPIIPDFMIDESSGAISGSPTQEQVGTHTVTITIEDSFGAKASRVFQLNVANVNDPPYIIDKIPDVNIYENVTLDTDIYLNEIFSDPDPKMLDSLSYRLTGNQSVQVIIREDTRMRLITPDIFAPKSPLAVTITANDTGSGNLSAVAEVSTTMNITIIHRDHRPSALAIPPVAMNEDSTAHQLDLTPFFEDVDISYANDSLRYSYSGNRKITVSIQGSMASLLPMKDWYGEENITFLATDTDNLSACSTVNVKVRPINDPPLVQVVGTTPEYVAVNLREAIDLVLQEQRFIINATDPDQDPLSIVWTVKNNEGKKVGEARGITYLFRCSFVGDLSSTGSPFTVSASVTDGNETVYRNWTINLTNTDRKPVAVIGSPQAGTKFGQKKPVTLDGSQSNDEDQNASSLRYEWTSSLNGKLGTGAILITKDLKKGAHTITLVVTDTEGETSQATVIINITPAPGGGKGFIAGFEAVLALAALVAVLTIRWGRKKE